MTTQVRDLSFSDLDGLLALYRELHPGDEPLPARSAVEELWRSILADSAQIYVGCFVEGALVAACNAAVVPNLTRGARPYAVIENVVTARAHQRRGLGSLALQELLRRCWSRRCYKVMLLSSATRAQVQAFYEANGFDRSSKQGFVMKPTERQPNKDP
jgi:GNAT superfamily N-acetyltransferase